MGAPRIDHINVVVADAAAAAQFLNGLGIEVPEALPPWEVWNAHHRAVPAATTFTIDLDSSPFANHWGGLPRSFAGVVVNIRVDERGDVDRLHDLALTIGGRSLKAPYDAFWGSRYSVVEGPGNLALGLMSVQDDSRRSESPDPATFA